jgi:hypothetical protein
MRYNLSRLSSKSALSLILTTSLLSSSTVLTSCSKKEESAGSPDIKKVATQPEDPIFSTSLLKKIPATSAGVMVIDFKGDAYKKFLASPWGTQAGGVSYIQMALEELQKQGAEDSDVAQAKAVIETLKKLGVISADGKPQIEKVLGELVVFVDTPPADVVEKVNVGVFASAAEGANLKERLALIEGMIKDAGLPTAKETYQGAEGFAVPLAPPTEGEGSDGSAANPLGSIFFAATEKAIAISRSKATVESTFKDDGSDGFAGVKSSPEFQKAYGSMNSADPSLSMVFVSMSRFAPTMAKMAAESAAQGEPADFDPKTFPVDSFMVTQTVGSQLATKAAIAMSPRTDNQKTIFAAFDGATAPAAASKLPSDVAFALSLDTKFVSKLEPLLKDLQDNPASAEGFKVLKNLLGATLAVRNNDGGSPFPDLFFALEASNREELGKVLETVVGQAMASSGAPTAPWQSKEIAGATTRYFSTPLGIGMYVATPKDSTTLLVASSERAVKDAIAAAGSGGQALGSTLSEGLKQRLSLGKLGMVYLNFAQVANLVDSVKGSLAMFIPNSNEMDQYLDSNKLRTWGSNLTAFGYSDGVLRLESAAEFSPTK